MPHKRKAERELERYLDRAQITLASLATVAVTGQPPQYLAQPFPTNQTNINTLTAAATHTATASSSTTAASTTVTATEPESTKISTKETTSH